MTSGVAHFHPALLVSTVSSASATMADDQIATKAPEIDAAQESPFPGDSVAQEGPSMGVSLGILSIQLS